ncbi:MAG: efflux RND transporter permease subunit [Peptococcaceae bacterium]
MKLANLSVERPIGILMVILVILLLGAVSLSRLAIDLFPELNLPVALVSVSYEGVGPEEIEKLVSRPLEEQMSTLSGIETVSSQSSSGNSVVIAQFKWGTDMDDATMKMREKVDFIKSYLPDDISQPMIMKLDLNSMPIMMVGVSGERDLNDLKKIVEDKIQPRVERIDGVASLNIMGGRTREIHVEVDPYKLQAYGLSISNITQVIQVENNNSSGGYVEQGNKDYLLRVKGEYTSLQELEDTLIPLQNGTSIQLKYLADINDTYEDLSSYTLLNGKPTIGISIQKQSDANTVEVSDAVNKAFAEMEKDLPGNIVIRSAFDQAQFIRDAINRVIYNGYIGAVLAVIILFLFLRSLRSTLIIGTAIPISIITTFILVYFAGLTLNMMSLGGLALGIGMMVDSAIVILENIYRHRQEGMGRLEAAKFGASEVGTAVVASTLTTVAVFLPIVYVEGIAAQIFRPLALTVSFSLFASLMVALSLIPMLSSKLLIVENNGNGHGKPKNIFQRMSKGWGKVLNTIDDKYQIMLTWALKHRKTVIFSALALLIVSVALIPTVGMEFMPQQDGGSFQVSISLPNSTVLEETTAVTEKVEEIILGIPEVDSVFVAIGGGQGGPMGGSESNSASIYGNLVTLKERERSVFEVMEDVRVKTKDIAGAEISISGEQGMGGSSSPINITIKGDDLSVLEELAEEFAQVVRSVPGTREVTTSLEDVAPELSVRLDREKAAKYGISSAQVSQTLRTGLQGATASKYRSGGDEIDIKIIMPEAYRKSLDDVQRLMIPSQMGFNVPLEEVAEVSYETGPTTISRVDQSRQVAVSGDILDRDLRSVTAEIQQDVKDIALPVGYEVEFGGANEDMMESFISLAQALVLAIIIVYMILAAQFEALLYPLIIMFSIPPTLVGIVAGLLISGRSFSVPAFIGVIMLAGIVVNNAIVLVDYINTLRKRGMDKEEAILKAGPTRLRPILMTTLTTVLALAPSALGIGEGAETMAPMATSVVAGLIFSTLVTLVLIPVMYYIMDDWGRKITSKFTRTVTGETGSEEGMSNV